MANSFDKQTAISDAIAAQKEAQYEVDNIVAAYARVKNKLAATRATVNANANGYFVNPDDVNRIDALITSLKAQITAAMA